MEDYTKQLSFSYWSGDEHVEVSKDYEDMTAWHEIMPDFFRFLNATGYIIPQKWIDDYCDFMENHKPGYELGAEDLEEDDLYNPEDDEEWSELEPEWENMHD